MSAMNDIAEQVRAVKQRLRTLMNGPVSQSMRQKGLAYKVNFGVELPRLVALAAELPRDERLATALWQEDIRECRLLAAMVQPAEAFTPAEADLWVGQMRFPEEAECVVLYLFSRLPYASQKAFEWMASDRELTQLCGFCLVGRLLGAGAAPSERDAAELLDQIEAAWPQGGAVAAAARRALLKYMALGPEAERRGTALLDAHGWF